MAGCSACAGLAYLMDGDKQLWSIAAGAAGAVVARPLAQPPVPGRPGVVSPVRWYGGALWFGCGDGLCEWRDGQLKSWGPDQGLPADGWANLHVARDGSLWARSGRWLARLARGAEQFEDRDGAILTTTDKGVARWDGNAWREWTRLDGLPDTGIRALSFDAEGSLWLGAGGRGVYRWVGYGQAHHWTREDGLPSNVVTDLQQDGSGRLWAATREGVAWFDEAGRRFAGGAQLAVDDGHRRRLVVDRERPAVHREGRQHQGAPGDARPAVRWRRHGFPRLLRLRPRRGRAADARGRGAAS
jgi:ligand-binding sensor domain-containing protein